MAAEEESRIPVGQFRRSRSMRLRGERGPPSPGQCPPITESRESSAGRAPLPGPGAPRSRSMSLSFPQSGAKRMSKTPVKSPTYPRAFPSNGHAVLPPCRPAPAPQPDSPRTPPHTPPGSPVECDALDDDLESLHSYSSVATTASCDHAYVARNGTTFSGRKMKYVVHCSHHAGQTGQEYLTPTQRAQRQIRRLKALLHEAQLDLEKKDSDIFRLTKEVVQLRLYKAALVSPDDKSNSSDAVTVKENTPDDVHTPDSPNLADLTDDGPVRSDSERQASGGFKGDQITSCSLHLSDLHSSLADSGHFEDLTNSSMHSKESMGLATQDRACGTDYIDKEDERRKLIHIYEKKIEDITRRHGDDTQEMKKIHNDRVEAILQKLADVNTRYCGIVPDYDQAKERIRELEKQLEDVSTQLAQQEEKHHKMYLQMYTKGQEATQLEYANQVLELTHAPTSRVSVPELLQELQVTQRELDNIRDLNYSQERMSPQSRTLLSAKEAVSLWVLGARKAMYKRIVEAQAGSRRSVDPEVTLQFLKSAIYYFLTDRENHQGHLNAIESILGFSESEKQNIQRARLN